MEYIVFCDKANKAYEIQRGRVCPACGEASDNNINHVVMGVPKQFNRLGRRNLFRAFLGACKATKGCHNAVYAVVGNNPSRG